LIFRDSLVPMPRPTNPPAPQAGIDSSLILRILQVGVACCFVGHGAFGVITKAAWLPYFGVAGIEPAVAWELMPWVGWMDIAIGVAVLLRPSRALLAWAVVWTVWTALLRPLSGESFWETLERGGNYGAPLAWLWLVGLGGPWFARLGFSSASLTGANRRSTRWVMRICVTLLLCGHAGYGLLLHKGSLAHHYAALGLPDPSGWVPLIGAAEFLLGAAVLFRPTAKLLLAVAVWKIATELLYPISGSPFWEFIERFGSYTVPLAFALVLRLDRCLSLKSDPRPSPTTQVSSC
jgi:hypothetical protein